MYIEPRAGYKPVAEGMVLKLNKALSGLKQSPRARNMALDKFLLKDLKIAVYLWAVYVDDLVIAGTTQKVFTTFKQQITSMYECKDLGALDRILTKEGGLFLSHSLYIQDVLGRFKTRQPGPNASLDWAETPMDHRIRLHENGSTRMRFKPKEKDITKGAENGARIFPRERWLGHYCG